MPLLREPDQKLNRRFKEEKKEIAADGKVVLSRKLKSQKIPLNEKTINELVSYFKLSTSLDLFYRVGAGTIDNKMIKEFATQRSNALMTFIKNRIRKPNTPPDVDRDEITSKYDTLVFGPEEQKLDFTTAKMLQSYSWRSSIWVYYYKRGHQSP